MDEPMSNLDAKLRGQMRAELAMMSKNIKKNIIYVTHDQIDHDACRSHRRDERWLFNNMVHLENCSKSLATNSLPDLLACRQ